MCERQLSEVRSAAACTGAKTLTLFPSASARVQLVSGVKVSRSEAAGTTGSAAAASSVVEELLRGGPWEEVGRQSSPGWAAQGEPGMS